jgi:hypothetical protein
MHGAHARRIIANAELCRADNEYRLSLLPSQ